MKSRVQLKNVRYSEWNSDETNCFAATIYVDGKKIGECQNDGHGGSTVFYPHDIESILDDIAVQEMPVEETPPEWGEVLKIHPTAEILVDRLLMDTIILKDMKRKLKKYCVFTKVGEPGLYERRGFYPIDKGTIGVVLNALPIDEAFEIYKKAVLS